MATVIEHSGWRVDAAAGDDTYGIVIGSGSTPIDIDDYELETKIAHGSGAGQLDYGVCTIHNFVVEGDVTTLTLKRLYTNKGVSAVSITEVGYIVKTHDNDYLDSANVLQARDIIDEIVLGVGQALPVFIDIRVTA